MSGCRYRKCQPQLCRFARNSKDLRHLVSCLKEEDEENLAKMEQSTSQRPLKKLAIDLQGDITTVTRGLPLTKNRRKNTSNNLGRLHHERKSNGKKKE
ncbi:hypothetical protein T05_2240 [Trichinella murrelli]|uniref:Uncharacterized protein n=1 Tax=Trichinella murrelli TaxID=144512 RepID=A0A0V0T5W9_9BILA|nr:hypothetical protein T05_2240 [Trichinella murrelli]